MASSQHLEPASPQAGAWTSSWARPSAQRRASTRQSQRSSGPAVLTLRPTRSTSDPVGRPQAERVGFRTHDRLATGNGFETAPLRPQTPSQSQAGCSGGRLGNEIEMECTAGAMAQSLAGLYPLFFRSLPRHPRHRPRIPAGTRRAGQHRVDESPGAAHGRFQISLFESRRITGNTGIPRRPSGGRRHFEAIGQSQPATLRLGVECPAQFVGSNRRAVREGGEIGQIPVAGALLDMAVGARTTLQQRADLVGDVVGDRVHPVGRTGYPGSSTGTAAARSPERRSSTVQRRDRHESGRRRLRRGSRQRRSARRRLPAPSALKHQA